MRRSLPLAVVALLAACQSQSTPSEPQTVTQASTETQDPPQASLAHEAPGHDRPAEMAAERRLPPGEQLNPYVLDVVHSYPLDGSHGFHWPKSGSWEGTTRDVVYAGRKLTQGDPERRSYCCGLTFEVYVRALLAAGKGPTSAVDGDTLHELRLRFFGDSKIVRERRKLAQWGLESLGLGHAIVDLEDARAGDFVQFWRHGGSGHSAVFVNWVRRQGEIAGLTYWSTQSTTQGIGYHTEWIGPKAVKRDEIYVGRAHWPLRASDGSR